MSAGKSDVVIGRYDPKNNSPMCPHPTGLWVEHSDYAALESLLLDARAEVERLKGSDMAIDALLDRATSTEALAWELIKLLIEARAFVFKDDMQDAHTQSLPDRIDATIDAVGGRGLA